MCKQICSSSLINVLIIENHKIICAALKLLLERKPTIHVVGKNNRNLKDEIHIVILSIETDLPNHDEIKKLRKKYPLARILIFQKNNFFLNYKGLMKSGVSGIVHYAHKPEMLTRAIEKIHIGEVWFERSLIAAVINDFADDSKLQQKAYEMQKIQLLTKRELEVINLIGEGLSNKEICKRIFISEATIRSHLHSIFSKLEVKDRLGLAIYAYKHNLLSVSNDWLHFKKNENVYRLFKNDQQITGLSKATQWLYYCDAS